MTRSFVVSPRRIALELLVLSAFSVSQAWAESRQWTYTPTDGRPAAAFEAEYAGLEGYQVILTKDGKTYKVALPDLGPEDNRYVEQHSKPADSEYQTWTTAAGNSLELRYAGIQGKTLVLATRDGGTYKVSWERLDDARKQDFIRIQRQVTASRASRPATPVPEKAAPQHLVNWQRASPDAGDASVARPSSSEAKKSSKRLMGYAVYEPLEGSLPEYAKYTNFVLDHSWAKHGDRVISEARKAGLHVVLGFRETPGEDLAQGQVIAMAKQHRDVVKGVCWCSPNYYGNRVEELSAFGQRLKAEVPGVQFWCSFVESPRGRRGAMPVPPEVDRFIVMFFCSTRPSDIAVRERLDLPGWLEQAKGRPVLLGWSRWDVNPPGIANKCDPATILRCGEVVRTHGLAGLIIEAYGKANGYEGVETNPRLIAGIKQAASELDGPAPAVAPASSGTKSLADSSYRPTLGRSGSSSFDSGVPSWGGDSSYRPTLPRRGSSSFNSGVPSWGGGGSAEARQQAIERAQHESRRYMQRFQEQIRQTAPYLYQPRNPYSRW